MKRLIIVTLLASTALLAMAGTAMAAGWWVEYGENSGNTLDGRISAPVDGSDGGNATFDSRTDQDPDGTGPGGAIPLNNMGQGNPNTADGGNTPEPHGNFAVTTNRCKTCHAVHGASATSFRLLHDNSRLTECEWCHDATTGRSGHRPYGELALNGVTVRGEHSLGATQVPDSSKGDNGATSDVGQNDDLDNWGNLPGYGDGTSPQGLNCYVCHSVHGADILDEAASNWPIVRRDPQRDTPAGVTRVVDQTNNIQQDCGGLSGAALTGCLQTAFCSDCHNRNPNFSTVDENLNTASGPSRPNPASHPTRGDGLVEIYGQNDQQVSFGLTSCRSCHQASNFTGQPAAGDFPHQSPGHKLLADGYTDTDLPGVTPNGDPMRPLPAMDQICLGCHTEDGVGGGTWGVGISF